MCARALVASGSKSRVVRVWHDRRSKRRLTVEPQTPKTQEVSKFGHFENGQPATSPLKVSVCPERAVSLQVALLKPEERRRANEQCDAIFYSVPRFVQYVDDTFSSHLKNWYKLHLQNGDTVLDLCTGYESHLPKVKLKCVVGHGMCGPEMAVNPALHSYFVKDLNEAPSLEAEDRSFDSVLCCMGLQYLKYPEDICREVHRVLRPGGKFLISFTSHCFPEKTVTGWLERSLDERVDLVERCLLHAGFADVQCMSCVATPECPNVISDSVSDCQINAKMCPSIDYPGNDIPHVETEGDDSLNISDPFCGIVGVKATSTKAILM